MAQKLTALTVPAALVVLAEAVAVPAVTRSPSPFPAPRLAARVEPAEVAEVAEPVADSAGAPARVVAQAPAVARSETRVGAQARVGARSGTRAEVPARVGAHSRDIEADIEAGIETGIETRDES